jgi:hypothetical protein
MKPVHDCVCSCTDVRGTLSNKTADVKNALPEFRHPEHAMGGITVMKDGLKEQGRIPVNSKENEYNH